MVRVFEERLGRLRPPAARFWHAQARAELFYYN